MQFPSEQTLSVELDLSKFVFNLDIHKKDEINCYFSIKGTKD